MSLPLTKSLFVQGVRCPKLLWFNAHQKDVLKTDEAMMEQGIAVGALARELYPGGILIALEGAEEATRDTLTTGKPIYEATFRYGRYLCRVDILVPNGDGFDVLEVKSSSEVKPDHIKDISFQVNVLKAAGLKVKRAYLVHINTEFKKNGQINLEEFFVKEEITVEDTYEEAEKMLKVLDESIPEVKIGPYCLSQSKRQDCPAKHVCWSYLPKHNVMNFYYDKKIGFKLLESNIVKMEDVADKDLEKRAHFIQRDAAIRNEPFIDKPSLTSFFSNWKFPLYFFDFETVGPAIPVHEGARPFQAIPFQFSLHIMQENDELEHEEFLSEDQEPRTSLLHALESLGTEGSIVTYNAKFEKGVLLDLKASYPEEAARIDALVSRIVDLLEPFQKFYYYHPDQKGSCSIKYVLPALTNLTYEGMGIANGSTASNEYFRVTYLNPEANDRQLVYDNLRAYCKLDTLAMVEVYRILQEAISSRVQ